jgi:pimeloyl-ACP methyl ester carboxylesterase
MASRTRLAVTGTAIVVLVVVLVLALLWAVQRRLIYLPSGTAVPPAARILGTATDVQLRTADGLSLGAWHVPAAGADTGVTVLVAPGNAADRTARAPLARALSERGLSVLLFDYRGYGGNPGAPTEDGLAADVRAARSYLIGDRRVPESRLIYFGESLGTGVVTELAGEHPPAGIVLRSPFAGLAELARVHYPYLPARLLLRDRYPVAERVRDLRIPTVIVYGTADSVVPAEQSRAVAAAAGGVTRLVEVEGADHNDAALVHGPAVVDAVAELAAAVSR